MARKERSIVKHQSVFTCWNGQLSRDTHAHSHPCLVAISLLTAVQSGTWDNSCSDEVWLECPVSGFITCCCFEASCFM